MLWVNDGNYGTYGTRGSKYNKVTGINQAEFTNVLSFKDQKYVRYVQGQNSNRGDGSYIYDSLYIR